MNSPARIRCSISACSSASTACSAFSISVSTSPMPRIREAIRSGWNHSSWSSFSPVEASLIGLPVTARTESAAPPRASPSSFVSTNPVERDPLLERLGDVDRLLARHRVEDEQHVQGLRRLRDPLELVHQVGVDLVAARRVDDHDVGALLLRPGDALLRRLDGVLALLGVDRDLDLPAELLELVDRGGALEVGGDERGRSSRPCAASARAWRRRSSCPSPGGRRAGSLWSPSGRTRAASPARPWSRSAPRGRSSRPAGRASGSSSPPRRPRAPSRGRRSP